MEINFKDEKSKKLFESKKKEINPKNTSNQSQEKVKDSFDISKTQVPKDTREALKDFKEIDNFYLKLNQFAMFNDKNEAKIKDQKINESFLHNNWALYENKIKAYYENVQKLSLNFSNLKPFSISYRLIIGGEASIYETSLRLHHIYGIPYIPASGIKGVVRSYIISEKFESKEEEALKDDTFIKVFGSTDYDGQVTFFDAFPTAKPTLKVDIMNPHYGHYYNEGKAPTDTNNPIPINFLTVENTTFRFVIGAKELLESLKIGDETIEQWLTNAIQNHGLGAKTAVGYGYFNG